MTTGDTQPTRPLPPYTYAEPAPKKRRRAWPWVVALIVVAGLAVAAWFAGEWIARDVVTKTIREQVITQLSLPEDQPIDIVVQGAVLPQLIRGTLDDVTISSDDVELDAFAGDVTVHAQDIAIRGDADTGPRLRRWSSTKSSCARCWPPSTTSRPSPSAWPHRTSRCRPS